MPPDPASPSLEPNRRLAIKKYPNRRFYDSTRGLNVSLADLHQLVVDGYELMITDSATSEDITNQILTQLILEKHAPKLGIFPAAILHQIIRTQEQFLGSVVEQFVRQTLETQQAVQQQWASLWRQSLGAPPVAPTAGFDWTKAWMEGVAAVLKPRTAAAEPNPHAAADDELGDLRRQLAALMRRIDTLEHERGS